jgi:hypothetical protein
VDDHDPIIGFREAGRAPSIARFQCIFPGYLY